MKIDHIGIVVEDIEDVLRIFCGLVGTHPEKMHLQDRDLYIGIFKVGEVKLEFITPSTDKSKVSKFLKKHGNAIHHIAIKVSSLDEILKRCEDMGISVIEGPSYGIHNRRVVFLDPRDTGRILIEIVEGE